MRSPDFPETIEEWNAAQMATHERLFPFRDNLTTLMFIVDTAYTFEVVRAVLVELFCTPKSSTEKSSLRANKHGGSTSRTFIVENYTEDEFGQWATDEVTGEQGYIDDERSCFWTWDDNKYTWQSRPFKSRRVRRRKGKGNG